MVQKIELDIETIFEDIHSIEMDDPVMLHQYHHKLQQ